MHYPGTALLAFTVLAACKPQDRPHLATPVILDCEVTGTSSSRDFIKPSNGIAPKPMSEKMVFRVTPAPFKLEQWSDEKNSFQPLCREGFTCKSLQTETEYRFSSTLRMEDKTEGWASDDQTELTISRTTGAITSKWQMVHKSDFSHLVMTQDGSGACKPGSAPSQKF